MTVDRTGTTDILVSLWDERRALIDHTRAWIAMGYQWKALGKPFMTIDTFTSQTTVFNCADLLKNRARNRTDFDQARTVSHESRDPRFHTKYMEAGVMTFAAHCTKN